MLTITDLHCEYAVNPLGIDVPRPRLSWVLNCSGRNHHQTAYQVIVATSPAGLESGSAPDLWDSGKVETGEILVEYGGRPLRSGERCWWKVRAWEGLDAGLYSEPAWFEMGLLSPEDWQADWIGFPGAWPGKAIYFRRDFKLTKPVLRARIYMSGLGWSELRVNGQRVNDRVLDPPQSGYNKRILYSTDAVEDYLQTGSNTIGVICGSGWYGMVKLLLQLNLTYQDGSTEQIYTKTYHPNRWLIFTGPIKENSIFDGESYDARLEEPLWDAPDVPPKSRLLAACVDDPGGKRVAAALEPIKIVESLRPVAVNQPRPGVFVFDMGQNIAGWARLRAQGASGTRISLTYAETLYQDGTINRENLRHARAEDIYILNGKGDEIWEPRFTYHGFRYVQVEGYPGEPTADQIQGRVVRSAVEISGDFNCSSDLFNRIHQMVRWTEAGNLHSLPTDCPQRDERMGWLNDMAARTEEAVYNYNLARLLSKWIADIADAQHPVTGAITDTAPFRWGHRPADPVSVCYLLIPWLLYVHYSDTHTMADHFDGMKAWVDYLTSRSQDEIVEYSYYGDWAPPIQFGVQESQGSSAVSKDTPGSLVSTACYIYSARLLSQMARILGKDRDADHYLALSVSAASKFDSVFWDKMDGRYGSNNQSCNAITLYMGIVPVNRKEQVILNLVNQVIANDFHLTTGNICTKYLLEALSEAGRADLAFDIAAQETYPSWGYMLANGATTLWERWEKATGNGMNSHNHPMLGSVDAWFYRFIAGIQADPSGPGFERFDIRPHIIGNLKHARATLKTLRGRISCGWETQENSLVLTLSIPVGCQARVFIPLNATGSLKESDLVLWQSEQAMLPLRDGIALQRAGTHLICSIGSGDYQFTAVQLHEENTLTINTEPPTGV
jgi:alpha-L-rhamnosidase